MGSVDWLSRVLLQPSRPFRSEVPALPMPAAGRVTQTGDEESNLMEWVHQQRQANVSWAEIAQGASLKGCQCSETVLRSRYKRWRDKHAQADADATMA